MGYRSGDLSTDDPRMLLAFPEAWVAPEDRERLRESKARIVRGLVARGSPADFDVQRACPHLGAVPVELLDGGQVVAWLCVDCDAQLPAQWEPSPWPQVPPLPPLVPDPGLTARRWE